MIRTPLIDDVFDEQWRVRSITESRALRGHFDSTLAIAPGVSTKALALLSYDLPEYPHIRANCTGLALPGMQTIVDNWGLYNENGASIVGLEVDNRTSVDGLKFMPHGVKHPNALSADPSNALFLPQSGDFRLADAAKITSDAMVMGYYQVPPDFPWHDNAGHVDPIVLEEVAAQIVTMGFARWKNERAREVEGGELSMKYPILTFASSSLVYHTSIMPYVKSHPILVLAGKVGDLNHKRVAEVDYTLSVQYPEGWPVRPLISGHISATKSLLRAFRATVAQAMKGSNQDLLNVA